MSMATQRCKQALILSVGIAGLIFSGLAFAQQHGAAITKNCGDPVRACETNAECSDDTDLCTNEVCDTTTNTTTTTFCSFIVTNFDGFFDTLRIDTAQDILATAGGNEFSDVPGVGTGLRVVPLNQYATCASSGLPAPKQWTLPCEIQRLVGLEPGAVEFIAEGFNPTIADALVGEVSDQATATYVDLCTGANTTNCNQTRINTLQASSFQEVEDGCDVGPPTTCDDSDACTQEACNPSTGQCETSNTVTCDDSNACTTESCNPGTGQCETTNTTTCDDSNACTTESCNPSSGQCETTNTTTCDDSDACTTESCNPGSGLCETTSTVTCDDSDVCTDDFCDPTTGLCDYVDNGTCGEEICRTPGFWGARGGNEKGVNITLAVIGDGLDVCGQQITNTDVNDPESAIEAICINKGDAQAKLMRHLTAASLNCELGACNANTEALLTYCNGICADNDNAGELSFCSDSLDCWNNGGHVMGDLTCVPAGVGICALSGFTCETNDDCDGGPDTCTMYADCHDDTSLCDSNFPEFCPPGPASSPKKCNEARKETGYIFDLPDAGYNP